VSAVTKVTSIPKKAEDLIFGNAMDSISEGMKKLTERSLQSQNKIVRNIGKAFNSIVANLGKSQQDVTAAERFAGESRVRSISDAYMINKLLRKLINNEPESLRRIDRVLDPEFYTELTFDQFMDAVRYDINDDEAFDKIDIARLNDMYDQYRTEFGFDDPAYKALTYDDLSIEEKRVYDIIRLMYDTMHEINFGIGKISLGTYEDNKGKYSARLYNYFEIPQESKEAMGQPGSGVKVDDSLYKERGDISRWKLMNRLSDPIYGATKRMYQTMANKAIMDYAAYIAEKVPGAVSKAARPGYRKLGRGYGALSNRYVRDDIAEDFIGYFYADERLQAMYDAFKSYDSIAVRQFFKKAFTVANPGVHAGNIMGNVIFGALSGINPVRLTSNIPWALKQAKEYSAEYRYLLSNGVLSTDVATSDLTDMISTYEKTFGTLGEEPSKIRKFWEWLQEKYSGTDDVFKMAAYRSYMDMGYTAGQAVEQVKRSFQNYKRVGKSYDLFSKAPLVGNPFGKFGGDLMRIVGTGVTRHPLNTLALLSFFRLLSYVFSYMSGETDEERKIREAKAFTPKIPLPDWLGGSVSLQWKFGDNVVNFARILTPVYLYGSSDGEDGWELAQKFSPLPIQIPDFTKNPGGKTVAFLGQNSRDPVLGPLFQLVVDSDFRGAPILDPEATKFKESQLTNKERAFNALKFLSRAYGTPYMSLGQDLYSAAKGDVDYYERKRSPQQVALSFLGLKTEKFEKSGYQKIVQQIMDSYAYEFQKEKKIVNDINREFEKGAITKDKMLERSAPHLEQMAILTKKAQQEYFRLTKKKGGLNLSSIDPLKASSSSKKGSSRISIVKPKVYKPKYNR
jgi:hypothetical protein